MHEALHFALKMQSESRGREEAPQTTTRGGGVLEARPPRLLQMMLSKQPGGAETFFEKLAAAFAAAGLPQCLVIEPNPEREALLRDLEGVEVVALRFGGARDPFAKRKLRQVAAAYLPDAVLTWMNRASRRAPRVPCPVIGRLGGYYKLKRYKRCNHLVGITPDLVRHIEEGGWDPGKVSMIPNFGETTGGTSSRSDCAAAVREELGVPPGSLLLVALGRLHEAKAHDILIRAIRPLAKAHLVIAGEGPLRAELEALIIGLGLQRRTIGGQGY